MSKTVKLAILGISFVSSILIIYVTLTVSMLNSSYTVTFDTDGILTTEEVKKGELVNKPDDPTKELYIFYYWSFNDEKFNFNTKITEDITLVAEWKLIVNEYYVTFDFGGSYDYIIVAEGEIIEVPSTPIKEHYTFDKWLYNDEEFDFNTEITEDIKLVAKWITNTYQVKFESDNQLVTTQSIEYNTKITSYPHLEKDGYIFKYWTLDGAQYDINKPISKPIILVAEWVLIDNIENYYSVIFDYGDKIEEFEVAEFTTIEEPIAPISESHIFLYWSYNDKEFDFNTLITLDITLIAVWEIKTYTIKFDSNGGTILEDVIVEHNSLLSVNVVTKPNSTFNYWEFNNQEFDFNTPITQNMTLVAIWEQEEYTIIFSSIGTSVDKQIIKHNEYIIKPTDPTCLNRDFSYWSYNNEEFNFETPVVKDMVLIAVFTDIYYVVTFDTNGGSDVDSQIIMETNIVANPVKPVKEGYEFLYWSLNDTQFIFGTISQDITLTAVWLEITNEVQYYTVSFNASGGASVGNQVVVESGLALFEETTRNDYDFVYWMYNNQEFDFNTRITENITLVAKWQIHSFTVEFDSNGGSVINSQTIDMYSKATFTQPILYDYIFLYWELNGEEYNFNSLITNDIVLVAVWEKVIRYNVEFDSNGGSDVESQAVIKGNSASIPYNPTKDNYVFAYWMYNNIQFDFTTQITEGITLEAYWISSEEIVITFDTNGGSHIDYQIVENLSYIIAPASPTKEDHDFIYWALDGVQYDFSQKVTENITLTAVWFYVEPITYYTVTFISNSAVYKEVTVIANQTVSSFSMSTTTDYRFNSWLYVDGTTYAFTDTITEDITLNASWDERIFYNIVYDLDGGTFYNTSHVYIVEQGYKPTSFTNPTKAFHSFVEWQLPNGEKYTFNSVATYSDIYVTAVWSQVDLNIDYIDATKVYNSYSATFSITGSLPTGVTIEYSTSNVFTHVGEYKVTAIAIYEGNEIWRKEATYTITPYTVTLSYSGDFLYEYSGEALSPNVSVTVTTFCYYDRQYPTRRGDITFEYTTNMTSVGIHTVTTVLMLNGEYNANYILNNDTFDIEIMAVRQYNFDYEIIDNEITITGFYNSLQTELEIPSHINGLPVTTIASQAFYQNTNLTTFTLPDTIKTIESQAFYKCTNLLEVNLGNGLEEIGNEAFYYCQKLTTVTYGPNLKTIGNSVFYYCSALSSIPIGNTITSIGTYSFYYCNKLTYLPIGDSIETIGNYAFRYCTALTELILSDTLKTIGTHAFSNCTKVNNISLPNSLTTIGSYAFNECTAITNIVIPDSVVTMDTYAFYKCTNLLTVKLSNNLQVISNYTFDYCTKLNSVTFPTTGNLVTIGTYAFRYTALESLDLPNSIKTINNYAFYNITELTTVTIPDSVTTFGSNIFQACTGITSYKLPANIETIPTSIFYGCTGLTSITIPKTITTIGSSAFYGCSNVTSIIFESSNTVTTISDSAFGNMNKMTSFNIPISVTTLGNTVFTGWTSLTSMTIPASTTKLGNGVFTSCTSLTSMVIPNTVTSMGTSMFSGCTGLTIVTINAALTTLPGSTFTGCTSLSTIILPAGLTVIGYQAFYNCKSLTSFSIPSTVTTIQYGAFRYCTGLTSIVIPSTVTSITYASYSNYAFANTPDLIIYVSWEDGNRPSGWSSAWQNGCTIRYGYNM